MSKPWHSMVEDEILRELSSRREGLSSQEAIERLRKYGYNEITKVKRRTALQMFLDEFRDIFILLLIAATVFSAIIGYWEMLHGGEFMESFADTITIGAIILLCAVTGFVQEYRAEKAIEALKKLAAPKARVIRDGKEMIIPAKEVVPGDILVLEEGDSIPADARLIEVVELKTNEAILTGESVPVNKELAVLPEDTHVSERKNMVFSATHVVYGRGKAVAVATGMNTEFGKIAGMVQTAEEEETPLQRKLDRFASKIAKIVIAVCVIIFALEAFEVIMQMQFEPEGFIQAFMSSIALAISAVPEGLPAIVTIALALGAREFAKHNAIVRKLSAAESLGSVTVICSDKTGTITRGEMTVRTLYLAGKLVEVTGVGYEPKGEFRKGGEAVNPEADMKLLLQIGALCNNASLRRNDERNAWEIFGDPTEGALVVAAAKAGLEKGELEKNFPRVGEIPFTSERKRMTTIHKTPEGDIVAYMKGAPEVVLERCNKILEDGKEKKLTDEKKKEILRINEELAGKALRLLGMAYRKLPIVITKYDADIVEKDMVFVGLQGMIDPPREEAIEANKLCQKAGIKTVMITGDHKLTAVAVAKEVGIFKEGDVVLTGEELDKLNDKEFEGIVEKVTVYARVSPEHKLRIVNALKKKGHIVAMTGDGVNDAPAVKAADVGVAMGISGTDVTREAADLVLTDDNFATIVKAVEQGRVIYDNIRKYARFLLACNFDELLVIGTFAVLGGIFGSELFPLPLLPAMILWINLVTDGAPAVALATDPPDVDVMSRPPRRPEEGILHGMGAFIIASFLLQAAGTFLVFCLEYYVWPSHPWMLPDGTIDEVARRLTYREATTTAFVQAAMFELFVVWNCRSEKRSVWRMGRKAFKNKFFVIADIASIALTLGITCIPTTQQLFHLTSLSITDLAYVMAVASWGLFVFPEFLMGRKVWKWR
ncbi:MAG: cation-translocating P-type ATPase [Nitrososphaerota archaeon]|nr:cation-translocating P-type ATPase [Candidatus Bathyarchaeota archaeon]MDW8193968.1 cation-translocating P-type ATPase [Nitrososphaerota archaeon]